VTERIIAMKIRLTRFFLFCFIWPLVFPSAGFCAAGKIKIVATSSTLASIAEEITDRKADIYFIAAPKRDIHFIAPTPKDVMKLKEADVFIHAGLDLEAWRDPLLNAVGRLDFMWPAGEKQIDVSKGISLLEVPETLSRAQGDIHVYGNPHYWMDPENAKIIARNIAEKLAALYPEDQEWFLRNAETFSRKIDGRLASWSREMVPYHGSPVVVYHASWSYFAERFGLVIAGELELKPGIPPAPKHISELVASMKEKHVRVIITEPYRERRTPDRIAKETGARVLTLTQSVGAFKEAQDYLSMLDYDLTKVAEGVKAGRETP